jgi:hypothetical protein
MSLATACGKGDTHTAIALIEGGASVNDNSHFGGTPLHFACGMGHTATVMALIERGANVNKVNCVDRTPLHRACSAGHSATAIALLENGAVGVNDKDVFGDTPSYWACYCCTVDLVLLLIQNGAILIAADLQRFRDQPTVIEEQALTVEAAYKPEFNWRRRKHYAMFLSSIKNLVAVEHRPPPSVPLVCDGSGEIMGSFSESMKDSIEASIEAKNARLMIAIDKVLCRTNTQRLICSFL